MFMVQNSYTASVWSPLSIRARSTMTFPPSGRENSVFIIRSTSAMESAWPWATFWEVIKSPHARITQYRQFSCTSIPPVSSFVHAGRDQAGTSVCRSMTISALVFSFVSSHGSASHELTKLWSSSGSSLARMNSRAMSENLVNGEYRVFIQ